MGPNEVVSWTPQHAPRVHLCGSAILNTQGKEMKCKRTQISRGPPKQHCPLSHNNTRWFWRNIATNRSGSWWSRSKNRLIRARSNGE